MYLSKSSRNTRFGNLDQNENLSRTGPYNLLYTIVQKNQWIIQPKEKPKNAKTWAFQSNTIAVLHVGANTLQERVTGKDNNTMPLQCYLAFGP